MPPDADHVTAVSLVPEIVAVNCCCPLVRTLAVPGEMEIEIGCDTVIAAEADLVESAVLLAVTV